ncbi:Uncharacterised protein [Enterobacter hormaechei]|nr:Uncharacterised protein [Enterobacter hormaechei]SAD73457.1 Uncharacterised protein [Enterobacter hormaechei]SAE29291.1 Uncharacterised protein [Enterobacter hormaechei]
MFLLFPFFRRDFHCFSYGSTGTTFRFSWLDELTSTSITNYFLISHKNTSSQSERMNCTNLLSVSGKLNRVKQKHHIMEKIQSASQYMVFYWWYC